MIKNKFDHIPTYMVWNTLHREGWHLGGPLIPWGWRFMNHKSGNERKYLTGEMIVFINSSDALKYIISNDNYDDKDVENFNKICFNFEFIFFNPLFEILNIFIIIVVITDDVFESIRAINKDNHLSGEIFSLITRLVVHEPPAPGNEWSPQVPALPVESVPHHVGGDMVKLVLDHVLNDGPPGVEGLPLRRLYKDVMSILFILVMAPSLRKPLCSLNPLSHGASSLTDSYKLIKSRQVCNKY